MTLQRFATNEPVFSTFPLQAGKDYRNGTILDYGSLIISTLQRATTAREAVHTMVSLPPLPCPKLRFGYLRSLTYV